MSEAGEYFFREGCFITELSNSSDDPVVSIARARVEPGKTTRWHRLRDTVERYVIISGAGIVEIGDQASRAVNAGAVVIIPALCPQRIRNSGSDDLIFLAICTPRFVPDNYEDIEESLDKK
ncbi:MAG TPA: cupin domain-containing protein [Spongiibacteraceae bacterium]